MSGDVKLCVRCKKCPRMKNNSRCESCYKKETHTRALLKAKRIKDKLCIRCGKNPARENNLSCQICYDKRSKRRNEAYALIKEERRETLMAQGLCTLCAKHPALENRKLCQKCTDNTARGSNKHKKYIKERREKALEERICTKCYKKNAAENRALCQHCLDEDKEIRLQKVIEKQQEFDKSGLCVKCKKNKYIQESKICDKCIEHKIKVELRAKERLKGTAIEAYEKGLCISCKEKPHLEGYKKCDACRQIENEKAYNDYLKRKELGLCAGCGGERDSEKNYCSNCLEKIKYRRRLLKDEVFNHYGGYKCNCCGEKEKRFLTIDHINNDGYIDRKKYLFNYRWIKINNFPDNLQVLCMNCNYGKSKNNGVCPHITKKNPIDEMSI